MLSRKTKKTREVCWVCSYNCSSYLPVGDVVSILLECTLSCYMHLTDDFTNHFHILTPQTTVRKPELVLFELMNLSDVIQQVLQPQNVDILRFAARTFRNRRRQ